MNESSRPTTIRVLGSSLVSSPFAPQFKRYEYNGDQPFVRPVPSSVDRVCGFEGCAGEVHAKGLCGRHYRQHLNGRPVGGDGRRKPFEPSLCGTERGYKRHLEHGVPACQPCRDASNRAGRERYAARKRRKAAK